MYFLNVILCWPFIHLPPSHYNSLTIAFSLPQLTPFRLQVEHSVNVNPILSYLWLIIPFNDFPSYILQNPSLLHESGDRIIYCANQDSFESERRPCRELYRDKGLNLDCSLETGMHVHPTCKAPDNMAMPHQRPPFSQNPLQLVFH